MNDDQITINEHSILITQIIGLTRNLEQAKSALNSKVITKELSESVRSRFDTLIENYKSDLQRMQVLLEGPLAHNENLSGTWDSFQNTQRKCQALFGESLAFLEGSLLRKVGLDLGMCELADSLLGELSSMTDGSYRRFTIPACGEFLSNMTDIIRVRFPEQPEFGIWNLPITAHEYGHFLAEKDSEISQNLFKQIIEQESENFRDGREKNEIEQIYIKDRLHECFADIFATYSLGPAFASTCILLNFLPETELCDKTHLQHPSNHERVYLILKTLGEMKEFDNNLKLQKYIPLRLINKLKNTWEKLLETSGYFTRLSDLTVKKLNNRFENFYLLLNRKFPLVRYTKENWNRTISLALYIPKVQQEDINSLLTEQDTLATVLNAGWLCQLSNWGNHTLEKETSQKTLSLYYQIMERN